MSPLLGGGAAGAGAGGGIGGGKLLGGAASIAGGAAGMPWSIIVPILLSIFGGLFEKSPEREAEDLQKQMEAMGIKPPFQNPYLPQMSEAAFRGSLGQMGRTQNWGWPEGMGLDTSWIQDMLANIQPALPPAVGNTGQWNPALGRRG